MTHTDDPLGDDLQPVMDLLSMHRPEASALELDAVKRRVLARAGDSSPRSRSNGFMRSRAAILTTLVLGFTLSTAGAGLAVTGFAGNDQASVAQYPETAPPAPQGSTPPAPTAPTEGVDQSQPEAQQVLPDAEEKADAPADEVAAAPADEVEAERQVAAGVSEDGNLPFTGFAAIPVLLIGLALLSGGMLLRRSARVD